MFHCRPVGSSRYPFPVRLPEPLFFFELIMSESIFEIDAWTYLNTYRSSSEPGCVSVRHHRTGRTANVFTRRVSVCCLRRDTNTARRQTDHERNANCSIENVSKYREKYVTSAKNNGTKHTRNDVSETPLETFRLLYPARCEFRNRIRGFPTNVFESRNYAICPKSVRPVFIFPR